MSNDVLTQRHDGVLLITWNRPHALNAVTPAMEREFFQALGEADLDPGVRVIVVTGAGRGFCAGTDLSVSASDLAAGGAPLPPRDRGTYPPTMRTPVIAAVNGGCAGVGLAMALHADVRFVAEDAKLTTAFTRRGLIAEHGVAWLLPRQVGRGRALDLLLSGRVFSGRDAHDYGLAEFCLPAAEVLGAALDYARDLARSCSPTAMATVKRQVRLDDHREAFDALEEADEVTRESFTWPDLVEGVTSWQERRDPAFPPARVS